MRGYLVLVVAGMSLGGWLAAQESGDSVNRKAEKLLQEAAEWAHQHKYASAIDALKKADKQEGGHCEACANEIVQYGLKIGDFKDADAGAQQLIADAKDAEYAAPAHRLRATVQLRQGLSRNKPGDYAVADREYQADLAVSPDDADALFYDGMALAHLNQDDTARDRFQRFLAVAPRDSVIRLRAQRYLRDPDLARARMAPAFTITALNGEQVSLDGLAGKIVLIDFWATWCGPCREALPHIQQIAQRFSGEPLVILSVSVDKDDAAWRAFVEKNRMTWLQVRDGAMGPLSQAFGVNAIPHTFTIDADGVLQDEHIGDGSIDGKLKKLCARARELEDALPSRSAGS